MRLVIFVPLLASFALGACVNPERVAERTVEDNQMSCQDIANELGQIKAIRAEADKGTGLSGANVAAAILFWPAAIGNYANAQEALEAADRRESVLIDLAQKKSCNISNG